MIEQQGRIIQLHGNEAEVQIGMSAGCSLCDQGKGCGAGIFGRLTRRKPAIVRVRNVIGARPGQWVTLGIPEKTFLTFVMRLYLLPLASALAGAAIGHHLAGKMFLGSVLVDVTGTITAAVFFCIALYMCRSGEANLPPDLVVTPNPAAEPPSGDAACQPKIEVKQADHL